MCSASATTTEAARLRWQHRNQASDAVTVTLPGRQDGLGREEVHIEARTVTLGAWESQALASLHTERAAFTPVDDADAIIYTGSQSLDSASARAATDQQIRKATTIADLTREVGFTAGSLRLWAAARHVTGFDTLITGAGIAGVDCLTLHRLITQQGGRGLQRSH